MCSVVGSGQSYVNPICYMDRQIFGAWGTASNLTVSACDYIAENYIVKVYAKYHKATTNTITLRVLLL